MATISKRIKLDFIVSKDLKKAFIEYPNEEVANNIKKLLEGTLSDDIRFNTVEVTDE